MAKPTSTQGNREIDAAWRDYLATVEADLAKTPLSNEARDKMRHAFRAGWSAGWYRHVVDVADDADA